MLEINTINNKDGIIVHISLKTLETLLLQAKLSHSMLSSDILSDPDHHWETWYANFMLNNWPGVVSKGHRDSRVG